MDVFLEWNWFSSVGFLLVKLYCYSLNWVHYKLSVFFFNFHCNKFHCAHCFVQKQDGMFESDEHVSDCRVRSTASLILMVIDHTVQAEMLRRYLISSHPSSKLVWDCRQILHVFWFPFPFLYHFSYLIMSPPYLTFNPDYFSSSLPSCLYLILVLFPFSYSLWRLRLALVVTFFISSILGGLRRDEIHSFVGGVEKKEGPRTVQHFIYGAVRSFMKPEVAPSTDV